MSSHPTKRGLRSWATGEDDRHTAHIAECEQCLGELELMTALDPSMERALYHLTGPPEGLAKRIERGLVERRRRSEDLSTFGDLFTLGLRTLDLMIDDD